VSTIVLEVAFAPPVRNTRQPASKWADAWSKLAAVPEVHSPGSEPDGSRSASPTDPCQTDCQASRDRAVHVAVVDKPALFSGIRIAAVGERR
jgi:hypothetical protein